MFSHSMVFLNQQAAADSLPREFTSQEYFVVFAKLNDDDLAVQKKTRLLVRKSVTDALGEYYRQNISQYRNIPENDTFFGESNERQLDHLCHNDGDDSTLISDAQESSVRPGHVRLLHDVGVSTSTAFFGGAPSPTFRVTRSSNFIHHRHPDYDTAAYPDLHSNGQGTLFDPQRLVRVSPGEGRRHLLSIALRQFAQHPIWAMVNFDNWVKDKLQGLLTVRIKRDEGLVRAAVQVTKDELGALVRHQHETQRAALSGAAIPPVPNLLQNAQRVMSNLKIVQSSFHGSQAEREDMRREIYALCFQNGPPHFMLTITPSDSSSGVVAIIACGNDKELVNEMFPADTRNFELNDAKTVERIKKAQELVSKDPAAAATRFLEISQFIFEDVLGLNAKTHKAREGILGMLEWYAGGIETQTLALCHFHVVGRVSRWPKWMPKKSTEELSPDDPVASSHAHPPLIDPAPAFCEPSDPGAPSPDQIKAVVDTLGSSTFPVFECFRDTQDSSTVFCPICAQTLDANDLGLFLKSNKVLNEPFVARCGCCSKEWTPSALRDACVEQVIKLIGGDGKPFNPGMEFAAINMSPYRALPVPVLDFESLTEVRRALRQQIIDSRAAVGQQEKPPRGMIPLSEEKKVLLKQILVLTTALVVFQDHR